MSGHNECVFQPPIAAFVCPKQGAQQGQALWSLKALLDEQSSVLQEEKAEALPLTLHHTWSSSPI